MDGQSNMKQLFLIALILCTQFMYGMNINDVEHTTNLTIAPEGDGNLMYYKHQVPVDHARLIEALTGMHDAAHAHDIELQSDDSSSDSSDTTEYDYNHNATLHAHTVQRPDTIQPGTHLHTFISKCLEVFPEDLHTQIWDDMARAHEIYLNFCINDADEIFEYYAQKLDKYYAQKKAEQEKDRRIFHFFNPSSQNSDDDDES